MSLRTLPAFGDLAIMFLMLLKTLPIVVFLMHVLRLMGGSAIRSAPVLFYGA